MRGGGGSQLTGPIPADHCHLIPGSWSFLRQTGDEAAGSRSRRHTKSGPCWLQASHSPTRSTAGSPAAAGRGTDWYVGNAIAELAVGLRREDQAAGGVDADALAVAQAGGGETGAHHGRHTILAGHDGGVG